VTDRSATVLVRLPAVLRHLAGGRPDARGEGRTVGEVLRTLERAHPGLGQRLMDAAGRPRRYLTLFLNDEDVRHLSGLETPVRDGDELTVVPAIAGGAPCR
jgi:molybdopterin synthase sulfur carrier subunit